MRGSSVPVKSTNEIVVLDTANWTETARIKDENFKQPQQVVFSADGGTAFVTNNNKMDHMADPAMAGHAMPGMDGTASLVEGDDRRAADRLLDRKYFLKKIFNLLTKLNRHQRAMIKIETA